MDILLVLLAALAGSVFSLVGGLYLIYGSKFGAEKVQKLSVPFAAGALLAAAFIDLIPEALHDGSAREVSIWILSGIIFFFVLERGLRWFHHHHTHENENNRKTTTSLIVIGDTIHNFIDGLAIGAAFLVDPIIGITVTIAVAAHEIPQEIGDFGLLLSKGMSKNKVLAVNILSAVVTVIGALGIYLFGQQFGLPLSALLAITAGFFIYIAVSDIIPTIHAEPNPRSANLQTLILLIGIIFVATVNTYLHQFIDASQTLETSGQYGTDERDSDH